MKLFFIVGTGRCGTQMLRNVLNKWTNVVVIPETHFIVTLYDNFGLKPINVQDFLKVVDNVYSVRGDKWVKVIFKKGTDRNYATYKKDFADYVSQNNINGNIKDFTESFFRFLYGNYYIIGDKTPHYGTNLSIIRRIWPDAKIIHLVRDGVYSAHSMLDHLGFIKNINGKVKPKDLDRITYYGKNNNFSSEKPTMAKAILFWHDVINCIFDELKTTEQENILQSRYEDIIYRPKEEIIKIAEFLNINDDKKALSRAIGVPRPFPEKQQLNKLNYKDYIEYYRMIKETMTRLGYPYESDIQRGIFGKLQEFYRGRYYYIHNFQRNLKKIAKQIIGKKQ